MAFILVRKKTGRLNEGGIAGEGTTQKGEEARVKDRLKGKPACREGFLSDHGRAGETRRYCSVEGGARA